MSIESVMPSNHLILCHPLLLLPPIPRSIRVFSNESTLRIRWPKYWSFSFNTNPSMWASRLRMASVLMALYGRKRSLACRGGGQLSCGTPPQAPTVRISKSAKQDPPRPATHRRHGVKGRAMKTSLQGTRTRGPRFPSVDFSLPYG